MGVLGVNQNSKFKGHTTEMLKRSADLSDKGHVLFCLNKNTDYSSFNLVQVWWMVGLIRIKMYC